MKSRLKPRLKPFFSRWTSRIPLQNSILREKHFQLSDFQAERDDNTLVCAKRWGNLKEFLSSGKMDIGTIQLDKIDTKQEFTAYVSTGGLMKPSDVHLLTQLTEISKFVITFFKFKEHFC